MYSDRSRCLLSSSGECEDVRLIGPESKMKRLKMRKIPVSGANCLERCCGTDVGFGLQKDKIIKVEYKL